MHDSLMRGEAPLASHLLYTQPGILDDRIPVERSMGIHAGLEWRLVAEAAVFYVDYGISSGMNEAGLIYRDEGIPYETRTIGPNPPRNGSSQNPEESSPEQPNPIDNV
jgi:hypothetical protein